MVKIQSVILKNICTKENWDYEKSRVEFETFYKPNKKNFKGGFVQALEYWINASKERSII